MNGKLLITLAVLLAYQPPLLSADNVPQPASSAATRLVAQPAPGSEPGATPARETAWLGVSLANIPDSLSSQLQQLIPPGQGVLVEEVIPASPAARAGIQVNDVLLAYDDQKLFSPRQLAGLIRADRPDRTVTIQAIHQGQMKTLNVTLGKQEQSASLRGYPYHRRHMPMMPHRHMPMMPHGNMPNWPMYPPPDNGPARPQVWDQFESVEVRTLPDGRYHAAVSYRDEEKGTMQFTYEGKLDEIRDQIQNDATLPDDKKQALLQALNLNPDGMFSTPMPWNSPFNDPFFNGYPFDEDFFRDFLPPHLQRGFPSYPGHSTPDNGSRQEGTPL